MDWFQGISDFLYLAHKSLGPLELIPIFFIGISALILISTLMDKLKIPSKYQKWLIIALLISAFMAYGIVLSQYPQPDWVRDR